MRANYHTHTVRCGHAEGSEREYIDRAVAGGLETLGFSDHTPCDFYDREPRNRPIRMKPEELPDYVSVLRALTEEYRGRITLFTGVEAEYYPKYFSRTVELLRENGVQYMILGQHFLGNEVDEPYAGRATEDVRILERYVSQSIEGLETGLFTYFAHPDLIHFVGDSAAYEREMRRLCRAALAAETPLEVNLLGLREGRNYPDERFWRIAGEEGCAVVLGCDAHRPQDVCAPDAEAQALAMLRRCGLSPLETLRVRSL